MHGMYISNSLLVFVKVLTILSVLTISRFYDNYTPRSGVGGLGQNIILCQHNSAITVCYCSKCSYYSQYDYRLYDKLRYYYSMI